MRMAAVIGPTPGRARKPGDLKDEFAHGALVVLDRVSQLEDRMGQPHSLARGHAARSAGRLQKARIGRTNAP